MTKAFKIMPAPTAGYRGEMLHVQISWNQPRQRDLTIKAPLSWLWFAVVSLPSQNRILASMASAETATSRFAGMNSAIGRLLSIPVVWMAQADGQVQALFSDLYFSSTFTPSGIEWTFLAAVG